MIELSHVSFSYGKAKPMVLQDVCLTAPTGQCTVLTGENGSGKSTLIGILAGVLKPKRGKVRITGRRGYVPQESALLDDMTVEENIRFFSKLAKVKCPAREELPFGIEEFYHQRVGALSGGMKKRVSLACALLGDPDTLLLDEPAASLDEGYRQLLVETLLQLRQKGVCLIYIGHREEEYRAFCDRRYTLREGVLFENPIE